VQSVVRRFWSSDIKGPINIGILQVEYQFNNATVEHIPDLSLMHKLLLSLVSGAIITARVGLGWYAAAWAIFH
jgi:hypothetical protein